MSFLDTVKTISNPGFATFEKGGSERYAGIHDPTGTIGRELGISFFESEDWKKLVDPFNIAYEKNIPHEASEKLAAVTRQQWADYVRRFFPLEEQLLSSYQNPEQRTERIESAKDLSNAAFDVSAASAQREAGRYGLGLESEAYNRQLAMNKTAGEVDAANEARRHLNERDRQLMSGGLGGRNLIG